MTDVVGSTALWERHEGSMPAVLARHDEIVHGAVAAAGGRVFKHTGDGMIAVFDDPGAAVVAARDACAGLAAESWSIPGELRIRSSLHAGPATERDGDFFGPALNRAARINGVVHPDQIVASDLVHRLLAEPVGVELGEHQLRDLGEPVRLWQLDDGSYPPLRSMRSELNNLPVQLTEFIGRHAEVEQLDRLLADHRLVTISGMGGCGKTLIALEVAAGVSSRFDGGTWLADLRSAADPEEIVQQVALAIGLVGGGGASFDPDALLYWMGNVDNLLAAAEWFAESGDIVAAAEVLSGRVAAYDSERTVDAVRWFTKAFVEDPRLPDEVFLAVSFAATMVALNGGDYLAADGFVRAGLDRFDRLGDAAASSEAAQWWGQRCAATPR